MKEGFILLLGILAGLLAGACGKDATLPTAPTMSGSGAAGSVVSASVWAPPTGVQFDPVQVGRLVLTNTSGRVGVFTFIVWDATDRINQRFVAAASATLGVGESATLTVGFPLSCGRTFQRDVYVGLPARAAYDYGEVQNFFYAGDERLHADDLCPVVPPNDPPPNDPPVVPPNDPPCGGYHPSHHGKPCGGDR